MKNEALIIIDVQNDYFPNGKCELIDAALVLERIKLIEKRALDKNMKIYYIQHIKDDINASFFAKNSTGAEIHPELNEKTATVITKKYPNSFYQTKLLEDLQKNGITDLVIVGMMTNMCVDATTRAAHELGFNTTVLAGACTTKNQVWNNETIPAEIASNVIYASLLMLVNVMKYDNWLDK